MNVWFSIFSRHTLKSLKGIMSRIYRSLFVNTTFNVLYMTIEFIFKDPHNKTVVLKRQETLKSWRGHFGLAHGANVSLISLLAAADNSCQWAAVSATVTVAGWNEQLVLSTSGWNEEPTVSKSTKNLERKICHRLKLHYVSLWERKAWQA